MFLRKLARSISFVLLCLLLAWYSWTFLAPEEPPNILLGTWESTFHRFGSHCIHWILMRIACWMWVYLRMLRLENGFSLYLFIRNRNFMSLFLRMYKECVCIAVLYYVCASVIMAFYFAAVIPGESAGRLLFDTGIPRTLVIEIMGCLTLCLVAYFIYCCTKRTELGMLIALAGRIALGYLFHGRRLGVAAGLAVNVVLAVVVLYLAARNFAKRIQGEGYGG